MGMGPRRETMTFTLAGPPHSRPPLPSPLTPLPQECGRGELVGMFMIEVNVDADARAVQPRLWPRLTTLVTMNLSARCLLTVKDVADAWASVGAYFATSTSWLLNVMNMHINCNHEHNEKFPSPNVNWERG